MNNSPHFIRLLSELLNLIGCQGNINSLIWDISFLFLLKSFLTEMFIEKSSMFHTSFVQIA